VDSFFLCGLAILEVGTIDPEGMRNVGGVALLGVDQEIGRRLTLRTLNGRQEGRKDLGSNWRYGPERREGKIIIKTRGVEGRVEDSDPWD